MKGTLKLAVLSTAIVTQSITPLMAQTRPAPQQRPVPLPQPVPDRPVPLPQPVPDRPVPLPLGNGRVQNPPLATGLLLTEAQLQPEDKVLIVDGAVEELPATLAAQVAPGGRIVTGLVDRGVTRLASGVRSEGGFGLKPFADIETAVLPGFEKPRGFQF